MNNMGLDCNYIANKIMIETFNNKTDDDLILTNGRLNKLVLLVNIAYMQKKSKFLVKNDYFLWPSGLVVPKIHFDYMVYSSGYKFGKRIAKVEGQSQEEYEKGVDPNLKSDVNSIVSKIVEITRYVDTVDLRELLAVGINEDENTVIYQEEIIKIYKNFDFQKLIDLNNENKVSC